MRPLVIGNHVWRVIRVAPGDPLLVDQTGAMRVATTDPVTRTIRISTDVMPPLLDRVFLHEATHAIMEDAGINDLLRRLPDDRLQVLAEESVAWLLETHAIPVVDAVSRSLGRPVCMDGICVRRT